MLRLISSFLLASWFCTAATAQTPQVFFHDLADPAALAFDDPFEDMGFAFLQELRAVVRLENRLQTTDITSEMRSRLASQVSESRSRLKDAGYDPDALIAQRWRVAEDRKQARIATNPALAELRIKISGFLIPAGRDGNGHQLGYLVPEIGMCSHKPPPPPNQLLRVQLVSSATLKGTLYEPMEVEGVVTPVDTDETIFVLDGDVRMVSRWTLEADSIEPRAHLAEFSHLSPWMQVLRPTATNQLEEPNR